MPPKGKDKPDGHLDTAMELGALLFALVIISYIIAGVNARLAGGGNSLGGYWQAFLAFFHDSLWPVLRVALGIVGGLSFVGIIYNNRKLGVIANQELAVYRPDMLPRKVEQETPLPKSNKWHKILELVNSSNGSDWRLAIMEADIMLDELLRAKGYHGDSVGEMLKAVDKSDMLTLESAWEGHKVRNRIAHSGAEFSLNERDARQTIAHFEAVFKEFKVI